MFRHSRDLLIAGGTFTDHHIIQHHQHRHQHQHGPLQTLHNVTKSAKDRLLEASALGAMHNSGERFDPPKCHPNTRVAVLRKLMDWFIGRDRWDMFILWLYGPAGSGKSAIAQTFAEQCSKTNDLLASFFFSRSDPKRNNEKALVATLAYQISMRISGFWEILERIIDKDPATFHLNFDTQFQTLIVGPLLELSTTGLFTAGIQVPYIIVIDGLDECTGLDVQKNILSTISNALERHRLTLPLMFLIASRPEHHLNVAFNNSSLNSLTLRLALDDTYQPDTDIRLYLINSFRQIQQTHIMQARIPESWPSEDDITELVRKSSGQFIYAATVIHYVSSPRHNPLNRLKVVQGLLPVNKDKPYAELDALYTNILLGVDDIDATLRVLGIVQIMEYYMNIGGLEQFMLLEPGSIQLLLIDLASVVDASDNKRYITFQHASFGDFLFDPTRSLQFYINPHRIHEEAANLCITHINSHLSLSSAPDSTVVWSYALENLTDHLNALGSLRENSSLREATLNMLYVQSMEALAKRYPNGGWVVPCFDFLKSSSFLNADELYMHHRDAMDQLLLKELSLWPPNNRELAYWISCMVIQKLSWTILNTSKLVTALPSDEELDRRYHDCLLIYLINGWSSRTYDSDSDALEESVGYLKEFFIDPARAGPYAVTDSTYTMAAEFIIPFAVRPWDERKKKLSSVDNKWPFIWGTIPSCLSKAGYSDELVNVLNHQNITFFLADDFDDLSIRETRVHQKSVYREVCRYLRRCTGFIPPGFRIIVDVDWARWGSNNDKAWFDHYRGLELDKEKSDEENSDEKSDEYDLDGIRIDASTVSHLVMYKAQL